MPSRHRGYSKDGVISFRKSPPYLKKSPSATDVHHNSTLEVYISMVYSAHKRGLRPMEYVFLDLLPCQVMRDLIKTCFRKDTYNDFAEAMDLEEMGVLVHVSCSFKSLIAYSHKILFRSPAADRKDDMDHDKDLRIFQFKCLSCNHCF
ncbi:uncharacterized protein [Triticum aestivum]|uniref:uncharacterized protein n=1 Tax=Triticum aestivum TaxID=4565 RepID=UPI001D006C51|nr:uncharacterized protein LOC123111391 [Triticum aestivum]